LVDIGCKLAIVTSMVHHIKYPKTNEQDRKGDEVGVQDWESGDEANGQDWN
jgi:hypothetical protein